VNDCPASLAVAVAPDRSASPALFCTSDEEYSVRFSLSVSDGFTTTTFLSSAGFFASTHCLSLSVLQMDM
jgi:hypothetical protein